MMRAVDVVRKIAPDAKREYIAAWDAGDAALQRAVITTPLRLAHLLAQCGHESGGFTLTRESMVYTHAERIAEIFRKVQSPGTPDLFPGEAEMLIRQEHDLGERFYGPGGPSALYAQHGMNGGRNPGNPAKARKLGNLRQGDGFLFRGNGMLQTTGGEDHKKLADLTGVDFFNHPELLTSADNALTPVLFEWTSSKCNNFADADDILTVSRAINMGNPNAPGTPVNMDDRRKWLHKAKIALGISGEEPLVA
jgi:putative chitinase